MESETALVLGATGGLGEAVTRELAARGWRVRALMRDGKRAAARLGDLQRTDLIEGDARDAACLARAAEGCAVIVQGVNVPYHLWESVMPVVTERVIEAAERVGARILFPGNVYVYGRFGEPLPEDAPIGPTTRKGEQRARLEQSLAEAAERGRARVLILRAGDYFGPTVRNRPMDSIFGNAARGRPMVVFGDPSAPHQYAHVPDLARLAAELLAIRDRLAAFERVHFIGHYSSSQRAFCELVGDQAGHPDLAIRGTPWFLVRVAGLFNPQAREFLELRDLFDKGVIIDDPRRQALLPNFEPTPLAPAARETLASYRLRP